MPWNGVSDAVFRLALPTIGRVGEVADGLVVDVNLAGPAASLWTMDEFTWDLFDSFVEEEVVPSDSVTMCALSRIICGEGRFASLTLKSRLPWRTF